MIYKILALFVVLINISLAAYHELPLEITPKGALSAVPISDNLLAVNKKSRNVLNINIDNEIIGDLYQINTKIVVGNHTFTVQVDTGSSLMAIPMVNCNTCKDRPAYDPIRSQYSRLISCYSEHCLGSGSAPPQCRNRAEEECDFVILYGDGSRVSGKIYQDYVSLSGLSGIANFGANKIETGDFEYPRADGILGFGRSCKTCVPTVFESLVAAHGIPNIFAMSMDYEGRGTLSLGEINSSNYVGDIQYTPLVGDGPFYNIKPTNFKIDDTVILPRLLGHQVIVDSGSSALSLASGAYDALVHYIRKNYCHVAGICESPSILDGTICYNSPSSLELLPTIYLTFDGGVKIAIPPKNYMTKAPLTNGSNGYCWMVDRSDPSTTILGDVFMRGYYTVFDNEEKRLGFAVNSRNDQGALSVKIEH